MINMLRKLQLSTRKQYFLGIPKSYIEIMELKKGDFLNIRYDRKNNSIIIKKRKEKKEISKVDKIEKKEIKKNKKRRTLYNR